MTQEQIQEKCDGEVYTLKEFCELCEWAMITSYDGHGYFHDGEKETDIDVFNHDLSADEVWNKYKYVCWYNK
jgi:hypothetical protein